MLAELNAIIETLTLGKNLKNRQLTTWLTEEEYKSFESEWGSQKQIREELDEKVTN